MVMVCAGTTAFPQSAALPMGARAMGVAHATACLDDVWSMHGNVGGLAGVEQPAAGFAVHAIPSLPFFNRMAAAIAAPVGKSVAGLGVFRFGDDLYREHILSWGIANTFGLASLGARVNYIQYTAEGVGTRIAVSAGFGGIASLTSGLRVGAYIAHINQPVIDTDTGERLPTRMAAAIAYRVPDKLFLSVEVGKELQYPATCKAGFEYRFMKRAAFRTGFNLYPSSGFFGLGFNTQRLQLDYALQLNEIMGMSHQASVTCKLTRK